MKLLPNINKSVPEAADPALIKPVSDALEALDTALGAKPSTLTTTAKTLVGAINEVAAYPEYISNVNGKALRFSDGTQICWRKYTVDVTGWEWISNGSLYYRTISGAQFAESFIAPPESFVNLDNMQGTYAWFSSGSPSPSTTTHWQQTAAWAAITQKPTGIVLNCFAIGRWK